MIGKIYNTLPAGGKIRCRVNTGPHDGNLITSIVLVVTKPSGSSKEWTTVIVDAGEDFVLLERTTEDGDVSEVGYYDFQAYAYGASGFIDMSPKSKDLVRRGLPRIT